MRLPKTGILVSTGALAIIMLNCWDWGVNPPPTLRLNDTLTVAYHDTLVNLDKNLWLSFDTLWEGRCPIGSFCHTIGWATVQMTFCNDNNRETFMLRISDYGVSRDTIILNYGFKLTALSPYPEGNPVFTGTKPEEYTANIFLTK
jgi:hypothetical protein